MIFHHSNGRGDQPANGLGVAVVTAWQGVGGEEEEKGDREETTEEEEDKVGRRRGNKKRANWALLGWPGWFHQLHSDIFYVCERSCIMQLDRISCSNVESDQTLRGWELISPLRQGRPDILDGERSSENFTPWFSPNIWTNLPWTHISDFSTKW